MDLHPYGTTMVISSTMVSSPAASSFWGSPAPISSFFLCLLCKGLHCSSVYPVLLSCRVFRFCFSFNTFASQLDPCFNALLALHKGDFEIQVMLCLFLYPVLYNRMQNDVKLPPELRRNYAHALDGLLRVWKEEGIKKLFSGASMAASRGAMVTVGQLSCYDQAKQLVLGTGLMTDNIFTHFVASFIAGGCATVLCQPMDVVKTRLMNSKGEYRGVIHCLSDTGKLGPKAFYKGLVPAGIRLIPHTVLTFIFLEQLRLYFGIRVVTSA